MKRYLALLRAVNVGQRTVKMDYLKKIFEEAGYRNVHTYIQSGNVIFDSTGENHEELINHLQEMLNRSCKFWIDVILRDSDQMQEVVNYAPFTEEETNEWKQYISFLNGPPAQGVHAIIHNWNNEKERYFLHESQLYVHLHKSLSGGAPVKYNHLEKIAKQPSTTRNWNTVKHLLKLLKDIQHH